MRMKNNKNMRLEEEYEIIRKENVSILEIEDEGAQDWHISEGHKQSHLLSYQGNDKKNGKERDGIQGIPGQRDKEQEKALKGRDDMIEGKLREEMPTRWRF